MLIATIGFWVAWGLIVYTYCVFPLLLAGFARIWGRSSPAAVPPDETTDPLCLPRVAMVVAAYNEAHVLPDKLINTWALDYPADRFQIFIGSDGSTDTTNHLLQSCDDLRL